MDANDSQGLLNTVLGFFVRKGPERSAQPASLRSRKFEAWLRTEAFLQQNPDEYSEHDPEHTDRTLQALENYVQYNFTGEPDPGYRHDVPYPKLQAMRNTIERRNHDPNVGPGASFHVSKRKRESDAVIQELTHLDKEAKRRRVLPPREEPTAAYSLEAPDADFAVLMRRHLMSLDNALRKHWICVCNRCSGLSVRLSLPRQTEDFNVDTCFEVFFGVRSPIGTTLQEAKITIKDVRSNMMRSSSEPIVSTVPDFAHICQSITDSLGQRNCLHFALEAGSFQRLRPQPKTFGGEQLSRTVSLSALFKRQQELRGSSSALPLKGKRILAAILATALLPFLETPWLQPSFNHSNILFVQPLHDGQLPDITKPFLTLEHIPIASAPNTGAGAGSDSFKHMVHPNATVLALSILLCELHYCTPVDVKQDGSSGVGSVNSNYYTSLDMLKTLEVDTGEDYYHAAKACLQWEYYPPGQQAEFGSVDVQRLFYQNVIKRLEAEISKSWGLRMENLGSFDPRQNELCWGSIGQEVVRLHTGSSEPLAPAQRSMSDSMPNHYTAPGADAMLAKAAPAKSLGSQHLGQLVESSSKRMYLFDASLQSGFAQESPLSQQWMDNLLSSVHHHVDPFDTVKPQDRMFEPVRIAILDTGYDPGHPLLMTDDHGLDPRIIEARSFVHQSETHDIRDEIGHGTHALGLLLKVATCAEFYVAKVANRETLDSNAYDDITKAIKYAVSKWEVDIISMSFGIREHYEPIVAAISHALSAEAKTLLFAAASNDGANRGRAFPANYSGVFCIHSTDGNGNPSAFNPTADDRNVNFSLLGENVSSHWPLGANGHNDIVKAISGTSVATPIAAGLAAAILTFVRQQEQHFPKENQLLGQWLKDSHSMDKVLKSMAKNRRQDYDYITPHSLFDKRLTREQVYDKIKDIRRRMYD